MRAVEGVRAVLFFCILFSFVVCPNQDCHGVIFVNNLAGCGPANRSDERLGIKPACLRSVLLHRKVQPNQIAVLLQVGFVNAHLDSNITGRSCFAYSSILHTVTEAI